MESHSTLCRPGDLLHSFLKQVAALEKVAQRGYGLGGELSRRRVGDMGIAFAVSKAGGSFGNVQIASPGLRRAGISTRCSWRLLPLVGCLASTAASAAGHFELFAAVGQELGDRRQGRDDGDGEGARCGGGDVA